MHRTITISVPPASTERLSKELNDLDDVISLAVERGASVKPPGDVLTVHTLNHGNDDVLRIAGEARQYGAMSVVTQEVASLIDPEHQGLIASDVDEAVWEEAITELHHHGALTANFVLLMLVGGVVATAALFLGPISQTIGLVAAAVIAPGFEPVARLPFGVVLRQGSLVRRAVASTVAGYLVLIVASAVVFAALRLTGTVTVAALMRNSQVYSVTHPGHLDLLLSIGGAAAGIIMTLGYNRSLLPGALMALALVPAAAIAGIAVVAGQPGLFLHALQRLGTDMALIVVLGMIIIFAKQVTVHHRAPLA